MGILDFVFPKTCITCGKAGRYICLGCINKTSPSQPVCPYCKYPSIDGTTHANCSKKLGIDGLVSIWKYEGVVKKAILSLKYKYATKMGDELADYLISSLKAKTLPGVYYLCPIPIHWYRQNTRGFNQSVEVGKVVSLAMGWNFIPDLLIKKQATTPQAELDREKRMKNLRGVFMVNPIYKSLFPNLKSVMIFDDVFTTGSTILEATKVLKMAGVEKVWGLTIAR